jgi:predicted transcriptional regulator
MGGIKGGKQAASTLYMYGSNVQAPIVHKINNELVRMGCAKEEQCQEDIYGI